MLDNLQKLLDADFMPHGQCYLWTPEILWLHVVSDALIVLAYYAIPIILTYLIWKRRELPFRWIFVLFSAFILACGTTHLLEVWTVWRADYLLAGGVKFLTAGISVATAVLLMPLIPKALALRNPAVLETLNRALAAEIAERTRAEIQSRILLEAAPDAVVVVDQTGRIERINSQTEKLFGYTRSELIGKSVDLLAPERFRERHKKHREAYFASRSLRPMGQGVELCGLHKNGQEFAVEVSLSPLDTAQGVRVIAAIRDVSERKRTEETLFRAQKMDAVGQLTGGIAHDFNNLLTVISGNLQMLEEMVRNDALALKLARSASRAADRGADLTQKLLAYSRRQALQPKEIDLNQLVIGVTEWLHRTLGEDLEIELAPGDDLWKTLADPHQVETALLNLALNARDAMPNGGCLTIETANAQLDDEYAAHHAEVTPGQYVMLAVSDTGTGMSPEVAGSAFEPFFTTKETGKGTGLGLSMVYGFVKQSGGHINVYSEIGKGTTVKIYLPSASGSEESMTKENRSEQQIPTGSETILVVEDDSGVRELACAQLTGLGYTVLEARDGPQALAILATPQPIDLLFTDLIMPGGFGGAELAHKALRLRTDLAVLFTSGYAQNASVHHAKLGQAFVLLNKPYRKQDLARKVREVLDRKTQGIKSK